MSWVSVLWTRAGDPPVAETLLLELATTRLARSPEAVSFGRICPRCGSDRHGRPYLRGGAGPDGVPAISISRTAAVTVVVMSTNGPVGVDVERLDAFRAHEVADVLLHPAETVATTEEVATTWVRKEALLKAWGHGLTVDARTIRLGPADSAPAVLSWPGEEQVWLRDLELGPDLRAAVAGLGSQPDELSVQQVEPEGLPGEAMRRTARPARDRS